MNILLTNDDGYKAAGISALARIASRLGKVTVVAPKHHQSGMGMAVSLGFKQIAYKELGTRDGVRWAYLDATPASCVKFGVGYMGFTPDIVLSGINHGTNASTAACYSGTLGAAQEAVLGGIPAIGVSLDNISHEADFSCVEALLPGLLDSLLELRPFPEGVFYNVNFPDLPASEIKGIRVSSMGKGRWIKEFSPWKPEVLIKAGLNPEMFAKSGGGLEEGEVPYMMLGEYLDSPDNPPDADHHLVKAGYISVTAHRLDSSDRAEAARLRSAGIDKDF